MGHLISAHNKSPAGDVAGVRIAKQKESIIRQNRSRIKSNDIVFPEKYFREAMIWLLLLLLLLLIYLFAPLIWITYI